MRIKNRKLVILGLVLALGLTATACGEKESAKEEAQVEVAEAEHEEEAEEGHSHEAPFEWKGTYEFKGGEYTIKFNDNEHKDESFNIGFLKTDADIDDFEHHAAHMMGEGVELDHFHLGESFDAKHEYAYEIHLEGGTGEAKFTIEEGEYYVFTEHTPSEFDLEIVDSEGNVLEASDEVVYEEGTEI